MTTGRERRPRRQLTQATCRLAIPTFRNDALMACGLSKSRLLAYRQCPKRLWLQVHRPELQEVSGETVMAFGQGHTVGAVAQGLQPDRILIETDNLSEALVATRRVLAEQPGRPIFEATFEHEGLLIRADIMTPEADGYRMTEVKASTRVKDYHLIDCAIQTWVCQQAGIPITRTELAHVDTGFIYPGGGEYQGLFHAVDVNTDIEPILIEVSVWVDDAQRLLAEEEPAVETGPHCHAPFDCPLLGYCTQGRRARRFRARGEDRRGQIQDTTSVHVRPPEVEDRLIPGHWEGDLIKGAFNRSAVGTLVERTSRLFLLVWVENASALAALEGFSRVLNGIPEPMRKTLTYDQGDE